MKDRARKFFSHLRHRIQLLFKNPLFYGYIVIFILIAASILVISREEPKVNPEGDIQTVADSFWVALVSIVAGYFDFNLYSVPGRICGILILALGMILISVVTGKIASVFMESQVKRDKGLRKLRKMKGHFLLCGWRPGFEKILDTVLTSNPDITPDMIVLVNEAPSEQIEQLRQQLRFKELNYISGDFSDESVLKKAFVQTAERALVISDKSKNFSSLEIDSRTVLSVITMENLNPGIYVAAELIDSKFERHLRMAHCDEIILTQEYEHSLLATASSGMGYSNVIRALISDDADSGILITEIPSKFVGKTYREYKDYLWTQGNPGGVIVGLLLNTGNFHQRRKDALREAQKNPDVKTVIENLKKVKTLRSNEPLLTPSPDFIIQKNTKAIVVRGKNYQEGV